MRTRGKQITEDCAKLAIVSLSLSVLLLISQGRRGNRKCIFISKASDSEGKCFPIPWQEWLLEGSTVAPLLCHLLDSISPAAILVASCLNAGPGPLWLTTQGVVPGARAACFISLYGTHQAAQHLQSLCSKLGGLKNGSALYFPHLCPFYTKITNTPSPISKGY